eukprot:6475868-Prymnesium_polylepis.1
MTAPFTLTNFTGCSSYPCAAPVLGDVAVTTVAGTNPNTGAVLSSGRNVWGPFEAGFSTSSQQDLSMLTSLGCQQGGVVAGGIDTQLAEQMLAHQCNVTLPRYEGTSYVSLLDSCGGHKNEYHFHERLDCLYAESGAHSTQVAVGLEGTKIYGRWEDYDVYTLPALDACGAHFGVTPDSNGAEIYHFHVQEFAPFTVGCYGPNAQGELVTVEECRALYSGCGDSDTTNLATPSGDVAYDPWCPCFDSDWSNVIMDASPPAPATLPPSPPVLQSCLCAIDATQYATYNDATRCFGANDLTNIEVMFAGMPQPDSLVAFYTRCSDYDNDGAFRANDMTNM